jgi:hypothetical protein
MSNNTLVEKVKKLKSNMGYFEDDIILAIDF